MNFIPVVPAPVSYPPPRYVPYQRRQETTWLDALHAWRDKTRAELTWIEESRREKDNRTTHIMTPVLTCIVYEQPNEYTQMRLRCAASDPTEALEGAKSAVRSRLDGKPLVDFYGKVEDSLEERSHCRYRVIDIGYTYKLDGYAIKECRSEGSTRKDAQQNAAKLLLEGETYCMFIRSSNGRR